MSSQASLYLGEETYRLRSLDQTQGLGSDAATRLEQGEVSDWCNSRIKRWFDLGVAFPAMLLCSPIFAGVALAIKLTSRGPVFFRQPRVGRHQAEFIIFKFRTMTHEAERCGPTVTRCGDSRLTRLGSFLRRSKLDEIPQLINVVRGEMSLVGPRPKLAQHEKMFLACRPGITGAATIVFCDEERMLASIPEQMVEQHALAVFNPIKVQLDKEYQRKASFATDLWILAQTLAGSKGGLVVEPFLADWSEVGQKSQAAESEANADRGFASFPAADVLLD